MVQVRLHWRDASLLWSTGYVPGGRVLSIAHVDPSAIEEKMARLEPRSLARLHVETIIQRDSQRCANRYERNQGYTMAAQAIRPRGTGIVALVHRLVWSGPPGSLMHRWPVSDLRSGDNGAKLTLDCTSQNPAAWRNRDGRSWSYVALLRRFVGDVESPPIHRLLHIGRWH